MTRALRLCASLVLPISAAVLIGCAGDPLLEPARPDDPQAPAPAPRVVTVTSHEGIEEDVTTVAPTAQGAPRVVFKIRPGPASNGIIGGYGLPDETFDVTFNMCASTDPDGDVMLFSIDDGDGKVDEGTTGGHCRQTIPYQAGDGEVRTVRPTVCVVDLDPAGLPRRERTCKTYTLKVYGKAVDPVEPEPPGCTFGPGHDWVGFTSVTGVASCRCPLNGLELPFSPDFPGSFTSLCRSQGFSGSGWRDPGPCTCY